MWSTTALVAFLHMAGESGGSCVLHRFPSLLSWIPPTYPTWASETNPAAAALVASPSPSGWPRWPPFPVCDSTSYRLLVDRLQLSQVTMSTFLERTALWKSLRVLLTGQTQIFVKDRTASQPLKQASALLSTLPREVIDRIVSFLPPECLAAFALTCRTLHCWYMPTPPQLSAPERNAILVWLEKDTPQLYICHLCAKLHTWGHAPRYLHSAIPRYNQACHKQFGDSHLWPPHPSYCLIFSTARLVMNRHFYGPSHGPPLDAIEMDHLGEARDGRAWDGVMIKQWWRARVIDDQLYLKATMQVYHQRGSASALRRHFDNPVREII